MIEKGDTVEFFYTDGQTFRAEVVHTPQGAGDSWQVRRLPGKMTLVNVYCSCFIGMVKVADAASCPSCHDGTLVWNEAKQARVCWICGKAEEA